MTNEFEEYYNELSGFLTELYYVTIGSTFKGTAIIEMDLWTV